MNFLYNNGAERYQFYRIPKVLFTDPRFACLSADAKILYGLMLDRASLSTQNGWLDEQHRVYIFFSTEEICEALGCARKKALKIMADLDAVGLTKRKIRGQGKPTQIYVREFTPEDFQKPPAQKNNPEDCRKPPSQECENHTARCVKSTPPEVPFSHSLAGQKGTQNYTYKNYTDLSKTQSNQSPTPEQPSPDSDAMGCDGATAEEMDSVREQMRRRIDYDMLVQQRPAEQEIIDEIVELITDTICTRRQFLRVGREVVSAGVIRERMRSLNYEHIEYALEGMKENTTRVRNIRQYLLTVLYNASKTISVYYQARVNHDLYGNPQL